MATVSVSANNTRVEDAESGTGWSNIGGGAGGASEGSFPYQGSNLYNRKVTGTSGFYYDPTLDSGSAQDMTASSTRTWMVKAIVTDYGGLNATSGLRVRIGSATSAYYQYVIAGTASPVSAFDAYTSRGGLFIIPIDPNIAAYRDATTGSPVLTAVDYFGLEANFDSSTAKSENVGLDAIDLGTGLTLTGGDGADPDGIFQDFVDADEGTVSNRWGYASSAFGGVLVFFGKMQIGSATATVFNDVTAKIIYPDGFFAAGFSGVSVDLQNASTSVTDGSTHTGLGSSTTEDTRPDYTVTGTSGTFTFSGLLENFRNVSWTSACTISGATVEAADVTVSTATISDTEFRVNTASGVAMINDLSATDISNCIFTQIGSGHAIEITSPGTYSFDNLLFDGFGANGSNAAAIYNNSGGAVTINVLNGGDTPTVRNGTSATTTVNNSVAVKVTVRDANTLSVIENARVLLLADTGGSLPANASVSITSSGTTATVTHTAHGLASGDEVLIRGVNEDPYNGIFSITVSGANTYTYTLPSTTTSPATGTITATAVILSGTTNASGIIQDTGFNYTSNQPVTGRVRRATL